MAQKRILVTSGSGFIASHCIVQLLAQGHLVRTTVRALGKEAAVRSVLAHAGMVHGDKLSFVAADLLSDVGGGERRRRHQCRVAPGISGAARSPRKRRQPDHPGSRMAQRSR